MENKSWIYNHKENYWSHGLPIATVQNQGLIIVTNNTKEFKRVNQLEVEDHQTIKLIKPIYIY